MSKLDILSSLWRPLLGLVCVLGFAMQFVIGPLVGLIMATLGHPIMVPSIDTGSLISLTTGALALSGLRTAEKMTDTDK